MRDEACLFFVENRTQITLDLIYKLSRDADGKKFIVMDVSSFYYPSPAPWSVPGILGKPEKKMTRLIEKLGGTYVDARQFSPTDVLSLEMSPSELERVNISIRSTIVSEYLRGVRPGGRPSFGERRVERRLAVKSRNLYSLTLKAIETYGATKVFLANERFAPLHSVLLAAEKKSVEVIFYGVSASSDGRFFQSANRSHDRVQNQESAIAATSEMTSDELKITADEILSRRRSGNVFSSFWEVDSRVEDLSLGPLALFATSSADETESLDLNWNEAIWLDQYDAFGHIWQALSDRALTPVLRVHPNLLNKGPRAALREMSRIRQFQRENPQFKIVWPSSPVSTYRLISSSEVVIVENSTVGVEASAQGLPVICANSCDYDVIADVIRVHGPKDLPKLKNFRKDPSPTGAHRYIVFSEVSREDVEMNRLGVHLSKSSSLKVLFRSTLDGSFLSGIFELRWKVFRRFLIAVTPKE